MAIRTREVEITPKLATEYLAKNQSNRNVRPRKVSEYKRQMEKKFWHLTPQGISISDNGMLLDGQHRLMAVIEYGKPVKMLVTTGVDPKSQQYMDSGIPRRVADNLKMHDGETNTHRTVAVTRAMNFFDKGVNQSLSLDETREVISEYQEGLDWLATIGCEGLPRAAYFYAPNVWLYSHGWDRIVNDFVESFATMEGLSKGSPIIALRKAINRPEFNCVGQKNSLGASLLVFNALHAYVEGESVSRIHSGSAGFDYFNSDIKVIPKKRPDTVCKHSARCTFEYTTAHKLCYLHSKFGPKSRKK